MNLEEKQAHFQYPMPGEGIVYFDPPELAPEVTNALIDAKLDGKYRFIWMGVAAYRKHENDAHPILRGDPRAFVTTQRLITHHGTGDHKLLLVSDSNARFETVDWIEPKRLYCIARQPKCICYRTVDRGKVKRVKRPDEVPKLIRGLPWWEFQYVSFGELEWHIEKRVTRDELIENKVYDKAEDVPVEEWRCIDRLVGPNGIYMEPSLDDVEYLKMRDHEDQNLTEAELADLVKNQVAVRFKALEEQKQEGVKVARAQFDEIMEDLESHCDRRPHSVQVA